MCFFARRRRQTRSPCCRRSSPRMQGEKRTMKMFNIAVIAGDGIGKDVVPEGIRVLEAAGKRFAFQFNCQAFDWSCETYVKTGKMMPADGLEQLRPFDAIFLWAVGHSIVADHIYIWGLF